MKKIYLTPVTETVKLNIGDAVLEIDIINNSTDVSDEGLGKQNNITFEDDFGDIWGDDSSKKDSYDLWGED